MQDAAASFMRLKTDDEEKIPNDLFGRKMESGNEFGTAAAFRALKFALKHPLTNDREVKIGNYARPTQAAVLNYLPKQVESPQKNKPMTSPTRGHAYGPLFHSKAADPGSPIDSYVSNKHYSHGYSRNRTRRLRGVRPGANMEGSVMNTTLQQIDEVLGGLNDGNILLFSSSLHSQ
jgi:hypothetical protein